MEPGTLYGALSRLERRGWVRPLAAGGPPPPVWDRRRLATPDR
jgi:DNA-binding PadR family transcriptional regulator